MWNGGIHNDNLPLNCKGVLDTYALLCPISYSYQTPSFKTAVLSESLKIASDSCFYTGFLSIM